MIGNFVLRLVLLALFCDAQQDLSTYLFSETKMRLFDYLLQRSGVFPGGPLSTANLEDGATIFAPTDSAWDLFSESDIGIYIEEESNTTWSTHSRHLLLFHIATEGMLSPENLNSSTRELETLAGEPLYIDSEAETIAGVALGDVSDTPIAVQTEGKMMVLYTMNQVFVPPSLTWNLHEWFLLNAESLNAESSIVFAYTTMANLALFAGLDEEWNEVHDSGLTLLIPPNRRFNRAQIDVPNLLTEEMKEYTRDFVLAHMIRGVNYNNERIEMEIQQDHIESRSILVESGLGTSLWITTTDDKLRFQSREVLLENQVAKNGIFHVLDLPVFPPYISDIVDFTAISTIYDTSECFRLFKEVLIDSVDISIQNNSSLTMFCPTFTAFANFNSEQSQRLLEPIWRRHAEEFLLNMITIPALSKDDMLGRVATNITMLNGMIYGVRQAGDDGVRLQNRHGSKVENSQVEFADILGLDGYVHVVGSVLTPTAVIQNIYERASSNSDFSLFKTNIDFVQLTDMVARDIPLTVLAPNNAAFRRVEINTLEVGDVLRRHVYRGLLYCDVIANQTELIAVNGETLTVELRGEAGSGDWGLNGGQELYVGGARLSYCDVFANNGILHGVDQVIGVEAVTLTPSTSPAPTQSTAPSVSPAPTKGADVITIQRRLNQTLAGASNFTDNDATEWERIATIHANDFLANQTIDDLDIQADIKLLGYYTQSDVDEGIVVRRSLQAPATSSVIVEYLHTLTVLPDGEGDIGGILSQPGSSLLEVDDLMLRPFNDPVFYKESFETLLATETGLVISVSNIMFVETSTPTRVPTSEPSKEPTKIPSAAPSQTPSYQPTKEPPTASSSCSSTMIHGTFARLFLRLQVGIVAVSLLLFLTYEWRAKREYVGS